MREVVFEIYKYTIIKIRWVEIKILYRAQEIPDFTGINFLQDE